MADEVSSQGSGPVDTAAVVQNFLQSLQGHGGMPQRPESKPYTTLPDLLSTTTTIPMVDEISPTRIDELLRLLPPVVLVLAHESSDDIDGMVEPSAETCEAALQALSLGEKKDLLKRVLRSPQFHQSLGSLTVALREGGLPSIAEALGVTVENNGFIKEGSVPLGGGDAVEAFVEGIKRKTGKK